MFKGKITSLKYTLQQDIEPTVLKTNVEKDIIDLYSAYFEEVLPLIEVINMGGDTVRLVVQITAKRDNEQYTLSRAIQGTGAGVIEYETKLSNLAKYKK